MENPSPKFHVPGWEHAVVANLLPSRAEGVKQTNPRTPELTVNDRELHCTPRSVMSHQVPRDWAVGKDTVQRREQSTQVTGEVRDVGGGGRWPQDLSHFCEH
jgi:hypothetical protein